MKKISLTKIAAFAAALLLLTSCGAKTAAGEVVSEDENAVVVKANETSGSVYDLLSALREAGEIEFSGSEGDYGFFIESVNQKTADPASEYWAVYTSLGELDGTVYSSDEFGTYEYDGKTLASASYGISGLPAVEGELYALVLEGF